MMGIVTETGPLGLASFSGDRRFRFRLERRFEDGLFRTQRGTCAFVMLNPSRAGADHDDPTLLQCKHFAFQTLGAARLVVVNLYAFIATDPEDLVKAGYPVGDGNNDYIAQALTEASAGVVCGWGKRAEVERVDWFRELARLLDVPLLCVKRNLDGSPMHPLYAAHSSKLQAWGSP